MLKRVYLAAGLEALLVSSACTGSVGSFPDKASPGTGGAASLSVPAPPTEIPAADACLDDVPGPRRVRRLSASEFDASIRSIFDDPGAPVATVFSDPGALGFSVDADALLVQGLNASQLMDNAEAVASWAVANGELSRFATCTTLDPTCARQFIQGFGRRAFRTTLSDSDPRIDSYARLFLAERSFASAAQTVIAAMLQSPYFVYRSELGQRTGSGFDLTPSEVASSLSYLLTGDTPDDTLLAAADAVSAGSLQMSAMIDQQADRLLATISPAHATAIMGFMTGWLGLDRLYTTAKDDAVFTLTNLMRDNMATETRSLILEAFEGGGSFASLLEADHSFLNDELARTYGLDDAGMTGLFERVSFTAGTGREGGLLAQGTILNGYARPDSSSPTQRGHLVRSRLLCQAVPPPPANVDTTLKPLTTATTTRQQVENQHSVGICDSCHRLMDPIGFGFEHYDGFGRHRDTENGFPIDASATLVGLSPGDPSLTFDGLGGPDGLATHLASSDDVRRCLIRYWSYYSYGAASWAHDACTYQAIYQEAQGQGFGLRSILMAILHAPNFTSRVADED